MSSDVASLAMAATLKDMGKIDGYQITTKHRKEQTLLGVYCSKNMETLYDMDK